MKGKKMEEKGGSEKQKGRYINQEVKEWENGTGE